MPRPSISVVNWLKRLSSASRRRQSILLRPIPADVPDPAERDALAPVVDELGLGPASPAQSRPQIVEDILADRNAIGVNFIVHGGRHHPRLLIRSLRGSRHAPARQLVRPGPRRGVSTQGSPIHCPAEVQPWQALRRIFCTARSIDNDSPDRISSRQPISSKARASAHDPCPGLCPPRRDSGGVAAVRQRSVD